MPLIPARRTDRRFRFGTILRRLHVVDSTGRFLYRQTHNGDFMHSRSIQLQVT